MSLLALALLPNVTEVRAASFDCSKANSRIEQLICQDAEVAALDDHLARYYRAAHVVLGRGGECLKTEGFVLHDGRGKSYLLRPLMFIEPEDANLVASAIREQESTYLVRGFLEAGEHSSSFDVSQCAYVYRLPLAQR